MKSLQIVVIALVSACIGAAIGIFGFIWVVGGSGEASEVVAAPTLDANALPTLNATESFDAVTQVANLQATIDSMIAVQEANNTQETAITETEAQTETTNRVLYRIDPQNSTASFTLEEDLRGVRTTVVGTTSDVGGDIVLDFNDPTASQIGTIRINARTLATDNEFRNRALRSQILLSAQDQFEFIEFTPTSITGLPTDGTLGEAYSFEVSGDLTIIGQTRPVTFIVEANLESENQLVGTASTSVLYADWGITIPDVPSVANVTDDVTLEINFVAARIES